MSSVRFVVARVAARELDIATITAKARAKGIARVAYEYLETDDLPELGLLTCDGALAELLAEMFVDIAECVDDRDVRIAAARAGRSALDSLL